MGEKKLIFYCFALCHSQAVDSIQAIGQIAVDSVTLYQDTSEYFITVSTKSIAFWNEYSTDFPPNLINSIIRNDGLFTIIIEDLIDLIEKYDDIVGNLCGIDSLNEFDSWPNWINPCAFDKNQLISSLGVVDDAIQWIDLNFQLINMAIDLYGDFLQSQG